MVSMLHRKLWRDLWLLRGQVVTIAMVVAAGVASTVALSSTHASLTRAQQSFYERSRMADVFATCKRAPRRLVERIEAIAGVQRAEARIAQPVALDLPDVSEPALGVLLSLPARGQIVSEVYLREGRLPARSGEVLAGEAFARARKLQPGDSITVVINGRRVDLRMSGVALSPEAIFTVAPNGYDDDARFARLWMRDDDLAAAFRMEGAFNDLALRLAPGARLGAVLEGVDRLLAPYGGQGARERARLPSHKMLQGELDQVRAEAIWVPAIFLLVAAFLVNVVLSRVVGTQREQIAQLKAIGYSNLQVGIHYLQLAAVVLALGALLGVVAGAAFGKLLTIAYVEFFRFPSLDYRLDAAAIVEGCLVAAVSALGAIWSVRNAVALPPAEAMRPPSPPAYRPLLLDRLGLSRAFSQRARMVLRDLQRAPLRLLISALGVGFAVGILHMGRFGTDSIRAMLDRHFGVEQRANVEVSFRDAVAREGVRSLRPLPGVIAVEPVRVVGVRFRNGHLAQEGQIQGLPRNGTLRRMLDLKLSPQQQPPPALMVPGELLRRIDARPGDVVRIEALDGTGRVSAARIAGMSGQLFGFAGTMEADALDRLFGDEGVATGASLLVDDAQLMQASARLKDVPQVAGATLLPQARRRFEAKQTDFIAVLNAVLVAFAAAIAVGVVYNDARVALAVRARDLATLRVLGCTRREISGVLLGELATAVVLALPLGMWLGDLFCWMLTTTFDKEMFNFPVIIDRTTRAFSLLVVAGAAALSALLVRRRIDRLDLLAVLKARE